MTPLLISVSGCRGIVGDSLTPEVALRFAAAFGAFAAEAAGSPSPLICLGRDTRPSGSMLGAAAGAGLAGVGARVVELGVVPTPTVAVMVDERPAAGGMVITASHNPPQWNGLKLIDAAAAAPPADAAAAVARRFRDATPRWAAADAVAPLERDPRGVEIHVRRVLAACDADAVRRRGFTVLLDPNHGAGCTAAGALLEALGCRVLGLHAEPDGRFARGLEPVEANLDAAARATAARGADVGFALDPDADRLAIIDERGRPLGEEHTLVLAAREVFEVHGAGPVVVNLSTSRMIDDLAARHDRAVVLRTPVGEANVAERMRDAGAVVGGEGNGGVIFPPVCRVRDALSAMALVLGLLARRREPLSALVDQQPRYAMLKLSCAAGEPDAVADAVQRIRQRFAAVRLDTSDGIRVDLADGWVHLRPSNTEPIVRLIAEADTPGRARTLTEAVAAAAGLTVE